jgi:xanthine dehydrogenase accessory factor
MAGMDNVDLNVLRQLAAWTAAGHAAVLGTVTRTWGSAPRPVGSVVAVRGDGRIAGSVSGGCIEDDLVHRFTRAYAGMVAQGAAPACMPQGPPQFLKYGLSAEEAHRFGLPCGGTLELLLEFDPQPGPLAALIEQLTQGRLMRRTVDLRDGRVQMAPAGLPSELVLTDAHLSCDFGPAWRMLLIGAGQLTQYLATMALFNGFAVTVCDPRQEYLAGWTLDKVELARGMPDDVVLAFRPDRRSCVVALTHDPKLDDLALMEALHSQAFYVGAIGSRRNSNGRRERLMTHFGETAESLARLRGPIGLYIGSKTPAEISVSVMAEILAMRNGVCLPPEVQVSLAKDEREIAAAPLEGPACGLLAHT